MIQPVERIALVATMIKKGAETAPVRISDLTSKYKIGTKPLGNEYEIIEDVMSDLICNGYVVEMTDGYMLTDKQLV